MTDVTAAELGVRPDSELGIIIDLANAPWEIEADDAMIAILMHLGTDRTMSLYARTQRAFLQLVSYFPELYAHREDRDANIAGVWRTSDIIPDMEMMKEYRERFISGGKKEAKIWKEEEV